MSVCRHCQSANPDASTVCWRCGNRLAAADPVRAAVEKNSMALRLVTEGKLAEALDSVNEAIRLAPQHAPSYLNRADIFQRFGLASQADADREFASRLAAAAPPPVQPAPVDTFPSWWARGDRGLRAFAYAGFWMRLLANLLDSVILVTLQIVVAVAIEDLVTRGLIQVTIGVVYTIAFWLAEGATPGKMALGIKVTKSNGEPIGLGTAVVRYVGYFVSTITLGIGYLMIAFTRDKRGLHDFMADTVVIKSR